MKKRKKIEKWNAPLSYEIGWQRLIRQGKGEKIG